MEGSMIALRYNQLYNITTKAAVGDAELLEVDQQCLRRHNRTPRVQQRPPPHLDSNAGTVSGAIPLMLFASICMSEGNFFDRPSSYSIDGTSVLTNYSKSIWIENYRQILARAPRRIICVRPLGGDSSCGHRHGHLGGITSLLNCADPQTKHGMDLSEDSFIG
jgi:hypothetical protein